MALLVILSLYRQACRKATVPAMVKRRLADGESDDEEFPSSPATAILDELCLEAVDWNPTDSAPGEARRSPDLVEAALKIIEEGDSAKVHAVEPRTSAAVSTQSDTEDEGSPQSGSAFQALYSIAQVLGPNMRTEEWGQELLDAVPTRYPCEPGSAATSEAHDNRVFASQLSGAQSTR